MTCYALTLNIGSFIGSSVNSEENHIRNGFRILSILPSDIRIALVAAGFSEIKLSRVVPGPTDADEDTFVVTCEYDRGVDTRRWYDALYMVSEALLQDCIAASVSLCGEPEYAVKGLYGPGKGKYGAFNPALFHDV